MKTLHEIRGEPTFLDWVRALHSNFTWEIEGDHFLYHDAQGHEYRDIQINRGYYFDEYNRWLARGAPMGSHGRPL